MNKKEILEKCYELLEEPNNLSPEIKEFLKSVRDLVINTSSPSL